MEFDFIYRKVAEALDAFRKPDLSSFDRDSVDNAFSYSKFLLHQDEWLQNFQSMLTRTTLTPTPFYTGIRGIVITYTLSDGNQERKVVIGPGIPYVQYWHR